MTCRLLRTKVDVELPLNWPCHGSLPKLLRALAEGGEVGNADGLGVSCGGQQAEGEGREK